MKDLNGAGLQTFEVSSVKTLLTNSRTALYNLASDATVTSVSVASATDVSSTSSDGGAMLPVPVTGLFGVIAGFLLAL